MKALILGGTLFLGRHLVDELRARHHDVTLFNRGRTNPELFPDVTRIHGDRTKFDELEALRTERFDAVIDTSCYLPRNADAAARTARSIADRYVFISSVSVYDLTHANPNETSPTLDLAGVDPATYDDRWYGQLKRLCEQRVAETFGEDRTLIVRPGLIVGPHDPTDRFTYWPRRAARGGSIIAPIGPDAVTQFIDVRDLARWIVIMLERGPAGIFNATSPSGSITFGGLLQTCRVVAGVDSSPVWCSERFLESHGIEPWSDLPAWISARLGLPGMLTMNVDRAVSEGLSLRPLPETVADTLAWAQSCSPERTWKAGLSPEREAELLLTLAKV